MLSKQKVPRTNMYCYIGATQQVCLANSCSSPATLVNGYGLYSSFVVEHLWDHSGCHHGIADLPPHEYSAPSLYKCIMNICGFCSFHPFFIFVQQRYYLLNLCSLNTAHGIPIYFNSCLACLMVTNYPYPCLTCLAASNLSALTYLMNSTPIIKDTSLLFTRNFLFSMIFNHCFG